MIDEALSLGLDINESVEIRRGLNACALAAELDKLEMLHYLELKGADISKPSGIFISNDIYRKTSTYTIDDGYKFMECQNCRIFDRKNG